MKKLLLATAFAAALAAPAQAGDKLPSCMAALEKSGMYRPDLHAEALGHPIAQARAREVAEELKNETPVLSIWSSPNMVDEFAQKIRARLIQKTADLKGPSYGDRSPLPLIQPTMFSPVIFSCFPDLQPVLKDFAQRLDVAIAAKRQKQQEAQERAIEQRNARMAALTAAGYKLVTVRDFVLDGRELAASNAKVVLDGTYMREGNFDAFFSQDQAWDRRNPNRTRILLLTENATRDLRRMMLDCQNDYAGQARGCNMTINGHATTCSVSYAGRVTREEPCIEVKEGS